MSVFLDEILLNVFESFDAFTLIKISTVCKQWNNISQTPRLWRKLVLRRWPSQRFLFAKASAACANWMKVYQELFQRGNFSPDDMKYFISCRVGEDELVVSELREAMFLHMANVVVKWSIAQPFEVDDNANFPRFNRNFDLYYDTHDLRWTFIDKRHDHIEDLMGFTLSTKLLRRSRFIRPYQVIPSCVMLYRWMILFRTLSTDDPGLTFYRIWRQHLKHRETGLLFEVCDWKAAMSCTFPNGDPPPGSYKDDCLELMDLLSHPNFIMHSLGLPPSTSLKELYIEDRSSSDTTISRQTSMSSIVSACVNHNHNNLSTVPNDNKLGLLWGTSGTESDDESELIYDSGYFANCEYFISVSHWDIEEQHTLQSSVAESWTVIHTKPQPHLRLLFDVNEESWYFYPMDASISDIWSTHFLGFNTGLFLDEMLSSSKTLPLHGTRIEPIPSCLALYRLICLFDMNVRHYVSLGEAEVWSVLLNHNQTQACLQLMDYNGWFEIQVTLTDELIADLKATKAKPPCDVSMATNIISHPSSIEVMDICEMQTESFNDDYDGDDDDSDGDSNIFSDMGNHHDDFFHNLEDLDPPDIAEDGIHLHDDESYNQGGHGYDTSGDGTECHEQSSLEIFKSDVVVLLTLLLNEKFGHPYGTIAGAVA